MAKLTSEALDSVIHDAVGCGDIIRDRTLRIILESEFPELQGRYGWGVGTWDWPIVEQSLMRLRSRGLIQGSVVRGRLGNWVVVNPLDELAKVL